MSALLTRFERRIERLLVNNRRPSRFERSYGVVSDPGLDPVGRWAERRVILPGVLLSVGSVVGALLLLAVPEPSVRQVLLEGGWSLTPLVLLLIAGSYGLVGRFFNDFRTVRRVNARQRRGSRTVVVHDLSADAQRTFATFESSLAELRREDRETFAILPDDLRWRMARDLEVVSVAGAQDLSDEEVEMVAAAQASVDGVLDFLAAKVDAALAVQEEEQRADAREHLEAVQEAQEAEMEAQRVAEELAQEARSAAQSPVQRLLAERDGSALDAIHLHEEAREALR